MRFDVVKTIGIKCRRCYSCVRDCPAKAIRVEKGQAVVIPERCIGCGNCVKVCTQNAKEIRSDVSAVRESLQTGKKTVACLAPSFPAEIDSNISSGQLVAAYKQMGFYKVVEVAFGADLVAREYKKLYDQGGVSYITTACPAVNYYVEKYHPQLVPNLTPVVSPMIAMGLAVRKLYGEDLEVVFIGPCISKKKEAWDADVYGVIDHVLTFAESRTLRAEMGINPEELMPRNFDPPHPSWGQAFPITGGALRSAGLVHDVLDCEIQMMEGRESLIDFINEFQSGRVNCRMAEILFCKGCISGPMIAEGGGIHSRKKRVSEYIRDTQRAFNVMEWQYYMKHFESLNLSRQFYDRRIDMREPTEEEIREILTTTNKFNRSDELNCKACGYESCRALAKAVHEGIAEKEMCLTYTIEQLEKTLEELHSSHIELQNTQQQLIHSEKQASLGQLAAGIAHEVNNPLGTILLYADLLQQQKNLDPQSREDVKLIAKESQRCKTIVSGLLDFSRQREIFARNIDLNDLLTETVKLIKDQKNRPEVTFILNLDQQLPLTELDFEQIRQVIVNLVINAIEAMEERGVITVSSDYDSKNERIVFSVADNGPGIPAESVKKLFTPFFTTKQLGRGTGLGLAICYGIIKMHRGDIKVITEPGKGACFKVTLPVVQNSSKEQLISDSNGKNRFTAGYQPRRFVMDKKTSE